MRYQQSTAQFPRIRGFDCNRPERYSGTWPACFGTRVTRRKRSRGRAARYWTGFPESGVFRWRHAKWKVSQRAGSVVLERRSPGFPGNFSAAIRSGKLK
jgi:hypothetical protein